MKSFNRHYLIAGLILFTLMIGGRLNNTISAGQDDIKNVTFYYAYGYLEGDEWVIPMKVYVSEPRPVQERAVTALIRSRYNLDNEETEIFRSRISAFIADSESRERVVFVFDDDPSQEEFRILGEHGTPLRTSLNGIKKGEVRLSRERAEELLRRQNSTDGWLSIRAVSDEHEGTGRIRLIGPYGLSVISDIDDTIKITEMPAGSRIVLRNTFFKPYQASPGMAEMYQRWGDAAFHYVSGTPRQFFNPLSEFFFYQGQGFPPGTLHMKDVQKNFLSIETWRNMSDIIINDDYTYQQKSGQIAEILETFPDRQFILVGDSGERDPEIFREMMRRFPDQIEHVYIRDVVNDRERNPGRLEGMETIPARTVEYGVSQF
jgi:hypothetical protein